MKPTFVLHNEEIRADIHTTRVDGSNKTETPKTYNTTFSVLYRRFFLFISYSFHFASSLFD